VLDEIIYVYAGEIKNDKANKRRTYYSIDVFFFRFKNILKLGKKTEKNAILSRYYSLKL